MKEKNIDKSEYFFDSEFSAFDQFISLLLGQCILIMSYKSMRCLDASNHQEYRWVSVRWCLWFVGLNGRNEK